jgi:hypothetical protein
MLRTTMQRERIARLLPEIMRPETPEAFAGPLGALLGVMEALHEPVEALLGQLDRYVDPLVAEPPFVLMLATWLDLDRYLHLDGARRSSGAGNYPAGLDQLRLLTLEAADLSRRRGTAEALVRTLELATGRKGFAVRAAAMDDQGRSRPFHIEVHAPPLSGAMRELVVRIVEDERPAHATYDLRFGDPAATVDGAA